VPREQATGTCLIDAQTPAINPMVTNVRGVAANGGRENAATV
jgi:hypothetical protein